MAKQSTIACGIHQKGVVFNGLGNKVKTASGFRKADLLKTKTGKIVTKKQHARGKKAYKNIKGWTVAVQKARKALGVTQQRASQTRTLAGL